jgi:hypothetical protein
MDYNKSLFGALGEGSFAMDESRIDDMLQVSDEENALLAAAYMEAG